MAGLQELDVRQMRQVVAEAAQRRAPVAITFRAGGRWIQLHSRLLRAESERLLLETPVADDGTRHEFQAADRIGATFKLKHHKYMCMAAVAGPQSVALADGSGAQVLGVCWPTRMQRIQRRAFFRAAVPAGCVVRASFWLGGREAEPHGTTPEMPVLTGRVTNISAGGFELRTPDHLPEIIEGGYLVGVRISFGPGGEGVFADARVRHILADGDEFVAGFQFMGLEQTPEGKRTLRLIGAKVSEYQRQALRRLAPTAAGG